MKTAETNSLCAPNAVSGQMNLIPVAESDESTTTNQTMSAEEIWRGFRKAQQELNQLMKEAGAKYV